MSEAISQYINSEKKLKIRIEKLLSTLHLSKFSGTVNVINGEDRFKITVTEGKSYCERSLLQLATLPPSTLFTLKTEIPDGFRINLKEYDSLDFIFRIVENIDRAHIVAMIKPIATEHFSIRPEASSLIFLHDELESFIGQKKIEIFSNFKKHYRTIFFLLLTRFASVVKATDEERANISEMLARSNMFDEKIPEEETVEVVRDQSEDQKLVSFLDINEKFKDVYHLFGLAYDFDEKMLHNAYLKMVQKIHPDTLRNVMAINRERAEKFFRVVSENYELLKNPEERADIEKLMKRYGPIKSRTDYTRMKEYDEAIFKGTALLRLGNFEAAAEIFGLIYDQTKNPDALEKKILAIWKKSPRWNDFEKAIKFPPIKEDILKLIMIKDPDIELLFILAEIYEFLKMIPDCMKILSIITKIQPDNFRAKGLKKRLMYYESLEKQGKK
ncbi:MAG TPA: DnaJ domain-containing protein [bacterium]|nr:DnaJ domain-containing protein [bacterium]